MALIDSPEHTSFIFAFVLSDSLKDEFKTLFKNFLIMLVFCLLKII